MILWGGGSQTGKKKKAHRVCERPETRLTQINLSDYNAESKNKNLNVYIDQASPGSKRSFEGLGIFFPYKEKAIKCYK